MHSEESLQTGHRLLGNMPVPSCVPMQLLLSSNNMFTLCGSQAKGSQDVKSSSKGTAGVAQGAASNSTLRAQASGQHAASAAGCMPQPLSGPAPSDAAIVSASKRTDVDRGGQSSLSVTLKTVTQRHIRHR